MKLFFAHFPNVYKIIRKMKGKKYKENQSRFFLNQKKKPHSKWKFEAIISKHTYISHIYQ